MDGTRVAGWLWSNDLRPIAELDANNTVVKRFIYANGINSPELMVTAGGDEYRLIKDHLGSVRFVVNLKTNQVDQEIRYDTWGRILSDSNPGLQPFRYAGGFYDTDTKLLRFGARDYDPETGRWLAKDPIRLAGGLNLYEYAASQPVGLVDWAGTDPGRVSFSDETRAAWGDFPIPGKAELCSGVPQTSALASAGVRHYWLRTGESSGGLWGGGMWNPQFAPAPDDWAHENYPGFTCEPLPDVEPACVNDVLEDVLGTRQGYPWVPLFSDCQNFAAATIVHCGGDPADLPFGPSAHYYLTHPDPGDMRP